MAASNQQTFRQPRISEEAAKLSRLLQNDPFQARNEAGRLDDILQRDNRRRQLFINSLPLQGIAENNGGEAHAGSQDKTTVDETTQTNNLPSQSNSAGQRDNRRRRLFISSSPLEGIAENNGGEAHAGSQDKTISVPAVDETTQTNNLPSQSNTTQTYSLPSNTNNQPTPDDITELVDHHLSVEQKLQQQVNFYENSLAHLRKRTLDIAQENKELYKKMNRSACKGDNGADVDKVLENDDNLDVSVVEDDPPTMDAADFSLASEPGEIKDIVSNFVPRDGSRQKRVTFDVDSPNSSGEAEPTLDSQTSSLGQVNFPLLHITSPPPPLSPVLPIAQSTIRVGDEKQSDELPDFEASTIAPASTGKIPPAPYFNLSDLTIDERLSNTTFNLDCDNMHEETRKLKNLYETKTKHIQLLLKSSKKQLQRQENEITLLKKELRLYRTPVKDGGAETCLCGNQPGLPPSATEKNLMKELLDEREELFAAIKRQQTMVNEGNRHEAEAYHQVKKSCELVEVVCLEKQEALVRVKQLEGEVKEYQDKCLSLQKQHQEELDKLGKTTKHDTQTDVEALEKKTEEQAINLSVLENQLEKCLREKDDLKKELDKFEVHSAAELQTTNALLEDAQKDVMKALKSQTLAEQETEQVRFDTRLKEKRRQQEADRFAVEIKELKRRLSIAQEDLSKTHQNQLQLTDELRSCKQELQQRKSQHTLTVRMCDEKQKRLEDAAAEKEINFTECLYEREKQYELAKEQLGQMIESQTQLVTQYQAECKELAEKLQAEQKQNVVNTKKQEEKYKVLQTQMENVLRQDKEKDKLVASYKQKCESVEEELQTKKQNVIALMNKQNAVLRDRYLLTKEVELLKCQHSVS